MHHNENECKHWLRRPHRNICLPYMARSILRPKIFYYERMKELNLRLFSLYVVMLILLAMLNDKYDVVLNETLPDAYDSTRQFRKGELPIAQS